MNSIVWIWNQSLWWIMLLSFDLLLVMKTKLLFQEESILLIINVSPTTIVVFGFNCSMAVSIMLDDQNVCVQNCQKFRRKFCLISHNIMWYITSMDDIGISVNKLILTLDANTSKSYNVFFVMVHRKSEYRVIMQHFNSIKIVDFFKTIEHIEKLQLTFFLQN